MLIHYIFARRGEKYSCYSPTYARFASILRPFMCNTLHLLNKIQTTLYIKCKKYAVIPAKAGIQTPRHGNLSSKTVSQILRSRFPRSRE
ncbi:hypothetical protein F7O43_04000 [Neisseria meningitidis]|nr:hypothetical protein [Neisseria meningitidis]MBG8947675.1 hypothetical protein [Neisseria meningitidis]MBJ7810410.1 hypothetical protein [Neisseria meningitidis]TNL40811.1 hypothetical protein EUA30_06655 [Neisseria meningitidis]